MNLQNCSTAMRRLCLSLLEGAAEYTYLRSLQQRRRQQQWVSDPDQCVCMGCRQGKTLDGHCLQQCGFIG